MGEKPQVVDAVADKQVRESPSQLPHPTPAPEKNGRDDPTEVENSHRSEASRESPDNPKKEVNWQFIGVVFVAISTVVSIIFGSLALRSSRENTEALRKIAEITAELVAKNPTEAAETAKRVQQDPAASVIARARSAAIQLQQQGKIEEAIEKWRSIANVVEDRQLRARAWFSIGYLRSAGEETDFKTAIDAYTKAIELNPAYVEAYNNRGTVKNNRMQYQAALADLDRAIELNPALAEAYSNRGIAKTGLGVVRNNRMQYQAALVDFDQAIELNPAFAGAYYNRGIAKHRLRRINEAREDYQQALVLAQEAGDEVLVAKAKDLLRRLNNNQALPPQRW